jgi:hypothetical protein
MSPGGLTLIHTSQTHYALALRPSLSLARLRFCRFRVYCFFPKSMAYVGSPVNEGAEAVGAETAMEVVRQGNADGSFVNDGSNSAHDSATASQDDGSDVVDAYEALAFGSRLSLLALSER